MRYSVDRIRVGGLTVALISFGITRLVVAESIQISSGIAYLITGVFPLTVGLVLTVYGVALVVGPYSETYARTVAKWCTLGTLMMVLVLAITSIESILAGYRMWALSGNPVLLANILLVGALGGVAFGHRTATNRRQRDNNKRQANRALLLDRLLRHEVLNAITIIRGYTQLLPDTDSATVVEPITNASDRISEAIHDVAELIEEKPPSDRIDVARLVTSEIESIRLEYPNVQLEYDGPDSGIEVAADRRLRRVIQELVDYASLDDSTSQITFGVEDGDYHTRLMMQVNEARLPDDHRRLLTSGEFPVFDDPSSGFSLPIIRLLVREYDGKITADGDTTCSGETITIELPKPNHSDISRTINVSKAQLIWATLTGIFAGVVMGGFLVATTDLIPIIGALYGIMDPGIGWTTHLFHSVVFTMIYAAVYSHPRVRKFSTNIRRGATLGVAWGIVLWLFAAGLVMPLWLSLVGVASMLPNLPLIGFVSHVVWGAAVGLAYPLLDRIERSTSELHLSDTGVDRF